MLDNFHAIIYTYKNVGLKNLEMYYMKYDALKFIRNLFNVELFLLQTCNRVELYAYGDKGEFDAVLKVINDFHRGKLEGKGTELHGREAVKHLFEVASGVDSLAVGEFEILRQIKEALDQAKKAGIVGQNLEFLVTEALKVGRKVRVETEISRGKVGTYVLAVEKAKKVLGDITSKKVLVIGAGEIAKRLLTILKNEGVKEVYVMNRTFEKGQELASKFGYRAIPFDLNSVKDFDVTFVAINYPGKVSTDAFVIDLSVPTVFTGPNVITLEELKDVAKENEKMRLEEVEKAKAYIEVLISDFEAKFDKFAASRAISTLMGRVEAIRVQEVKRAENELRKLGIEVSPDVEEILNRMTMSIIKKLFDPFFSAYYTSDPKAREMYIQLIAKVLSNGSVPNPKA